jgi:hypothetical protein
VHAHVCTADPLFHLPSVLSDLVDANRLNAQLLAAGPAVLLLALGSRSFFAVLHMLRTRGLRSMRQVHKQMTRSLQRLERCLVLAGASRPQSLSTTGMRASSPDGVEAAESTSSQGTHQRAPKAWMRFPWTSEPPSAEEAAAQIAAELTKGGSALDVRMLSGAELGEFALHVHSYLLLLDFSSPAYPAGAADAIHHETQELLRQGGLSVEQQTALLRSLKARHAELAKFL